MFATAATLAVASNCGTTAAPPDGGQDDAASDVTHFDVITFYGCPVCDAALNDTDASDASAPDADASLESGDE